MSSSTPSLFSLHSHRLRICLLIMLLLFTMLSLRVALSINMVCMVKRVTSVAVAAGSEIISEITNLTEPVNNSSGSSALGASTDFAVKEHCAFPGELEWSPSQQSLLLSATFYGSFACILFSGTVAERVGPKNALSVALFVAIFITLLSPSTARLSFYGFFAGRFLMGMSESFLIPSLNLIASRWFPITEKATVAAIYTSGTQLAAGFSSLAAAEICQSKAIGGWPVAFYIFGTIGAVIVGAWQLLGSDYPASSRLASAAEKAYLAERVPKKKPMPPLRSVPLRAMLSSPPVHSILCCAFAFGFTTSMMQSYLPSFLVDRLGLPIEMVGMYTVAPFISQVISKLIAGPTMDRVSAAGFISITKATKIAQSISSFGSAIALCLLAFVPNSDQPTSALFLLAFFGAVYGGGVCGFFTSLLSIAPPYAGTLSSLSQFFTMTASITTSLVVTLLTYLQIEQKWTIVFCVAALLQTFAAVHYVIFGSAEQQEWARGAPNTIVTPSATVEASGELRLKLIKE